MRRLLLEGGAAGHMAHLSENPKLTFKDLLGVFELAMSGFPDVEVTEKLDGQNILVAYDPDQDKALAIRAKKSHAVVGGLDSQELQYYFTQGREDDAFNKLTSKGIPEGEARIEAKRSRLDSSPEGAGVVAAFKDAMDNFEVVARQLSDSGGGHYFKTDQNCIIFYNAEVMDPRSRNVVDYDTQILVLHRVGHVLLCPDEDTLKDFPEAADHVLRLDKAVQMLQVTDFENQEIPPVEVNAIQNFENFIVDKQVHRDAITNLSSILKESGLSHNNTIGDFLKKRISTRISAGLPIEDPSIIDAVVNAVVFFAVEKKLPRIKAEISPILAAIAEENTKQIVQDLLRDRQALAELVKTAIYPLDLLIHKFAVAVLKGYESAYIIQNSIATKSLQQKVAGKMRSVRDAADEQDLKVLQTNLRKMYDIEDIEDILNDKNFEAAAEHISTAVEGLVFDYNGQTYKLTGQFAPINQIMGLGRFSRGGKEAESIAEQLSPKLNQAPLDYRAERVISILPGGFKPPHAGHYQSAKDGILGKKPWDSRPDKFYILIGNKARAGHSKDRRIELTAEHAKRIWEIYLSTDPDVSGVDIEIIALDSSPVGWIYDAIKGGVFQNGDKILVGKGFKDAKDTRFNKLKNEAETAGLNIDIQQIITPLYSGGISGTQMRNMACARNRELLRFLPNHLADDNPNDDRGVMVKNVEAVEEIFRIISEPDECGAFDPTADPSTIAESVDILKLIEALLEGNFQSKVAKPRLKKTLKRLLDKGNQKPGVPYTKKRAKTSNAFVAKEMSSMGGGNVAGGIVDDTEEEPGKRDKKQKKLKKFKSLIREQDPTESGGSVITIPGGGGITTRGGRGVVAINRGPSPVAATTKKKSATSGIKARKIRITAIGDSQTMGGGSKNGNYLTRLGSLNSNIEIVGSSTGHWKKTSFTRAGFAKGGDSLQRIRDNHLPGALATNPDIIIVQGGGNNSHHSGKKNIEVLKEIYDKIHNHKPRPPVIIALGIHAAKQRPQSWRRYKNHACNSNSGNFNQASCDKKQAAAEASMRELNQFVLGKSWARNRDKVIDVGGIVGNDYINKGSGSRTNIHYNYNSHQNIALAINNAIKGIPNFTTAFGAYMALPGNVPVSKLTGAHLDSLKKIPGSKGLIQYIFDNFDVEVYEVIAVVIAAYLLGIKGILLAPIILSMKELFEYFTKDDAIRVISNTNFRNKILKGINTNRSQHMQIGKNPKCFTENRVMSLKRALKRCTKPIQKSGGQTILGEAKRASKIHGIPASIILGVIEKESSYNPDIKGQASPHVMAKYGKSEAGLLQLHPGYYPYVFHPIRDNIHHGISAIAKHFRKFGNLEHALTAYNCGGWCVTKALKKGYYHQLNTVKRCYAGNIMTAARKWVKYGVDDDNQKSSFVTASDAQLSTNFKLSAFQCGNGVPVPEKYISNVKELVQNLDILTSEIGKKLVIISGYRTPIYNKKCGGAENSLHMLAKAADIQVSGGNISSEELYKIIEKLISEGKMKEGGLGLYAKFVHYDIRGTKIRWSKADQQDV